MNQTHHNHTHPSDLTDRIKAFRARFAEHRQTGIQASADGVAALIGELDSILALASTVTNEMSAHRWNRLGLPDLAEFTDPNSNVVPLMRRQPQPDGDGA